MKSGIVRHWQKALIAVAMMIAASYAPSLAATVTDPTTVKWHPQPVIHFTLTPNYFTGFGAVPAVFGTQPAPVTGPDATLDGGAVDFGGVMGGKTYLYKYAAHVNVTSNDSSGFFVYAEGAADFFNTADSTTAALNTTLFYLNSTSGAPADPNNGFSPGLPLNKTTQAVAGNGQFTMPTITYGTYPSPIATSASMNGDYYYDYELKVPPTATGGLYYVWVVYTVVAR